MASSWERLATYTIPSGQPSNTISRTITAKRYLRIEGYILKTSSSTELVVRFNDDSSGTHGSSGNYARRKFNNGSGGTDENGNKLELIGGEATPAYFTMCIGNIADREKLCTTQIVRASTDTGVDGVPFRAENFGKWVNTTHPITQIDLLSVSSTFAAGSTVTIWGADDQGTTPFYPNLSNGTLFEESDTGKIYMWDGTDTWNEVT